MYRNFHPFGCDCAGCRRDEGRLQGNGSSARIRPYEPPASPAPHKPSDPPQQNVDSRHPDACDCADCLDQRMLLEDGGEPTDEDEFGLAGIEDLDDEGFDGDGKEEDGEGESDDPDDATSLFGPSALPEPAEDPVAYSDRTLMDQLFGPTGQANDGPLVPCVHRSMCEPLVHGRKSLYAFEYHGAERYLPQPIKGLAVYEQDELVAVDILPPGPGPCRLFVENGLLARIEDNDHSQQPLRHSTADGRQHLLEALVAELIEDRSVLFLDADEADFDRAHAHGLF